MAIETMTLEREEKKCMDRKDYPEGNSKNGLGLIKCDLKQVDYPVSECNSKDCGFYSTGDEE